MQNNRIQKKESKIAQFFASEMFKIYLWQYLKHKDSFGKSENL